MEKSQGQDLGEPHCSPRSKSLLRVLRVPGPGTQEELTLCHLLSPSPSRGPFSTISHLQPLDSLFEVFVHHFSHSVSLVIVHQCRLTSFLAIYFIHPPSSAGTQIPPVTSVTSRPLTLPSSGVLALPLTSHRFDFVM